MCGIVGYVGRGNVREILIEGLERLEYRGYDSAGIALNPTDHGEILVRRCVGRVGNLKNQLAEDPKIIKTTYTQGIAHTRWATHGVPSEVNAHPHRAGKIYVVHNGIIENYLELKQVLEKSGVHFDSVTDTEVFAQLIESERAVALGNRDFESLSPADRVQVVLTALKNAAGRVEGHYAVLVMVRGLEGSLFGIQAGAPLVVANPPGELLVASDLQAVLPHLNEMKFLPSESIFWADQTSVKIFDFDLAEKDIPKTKIDWSPDKIAKGGFEHFMLKEIFEQSEVVADTLSGRLPTSDQGFLWDVPEGKKTLHLDLWSQTDRLILVACGTAYYAAMVAKYFFERWTRIPVEVDLASEFRYRQPIFSPGTLVGVVSQSGETADTLAALKLVKENSVRNFSVCNVPGSSVTREAQLNYPTKAGPEIGVASTKAFTTQLTILAALAQDVGRMRGTLTNWREEAETLARLPVLIDEVLAHSEEFLKLGKSLERFKTLLLMGRGVMYPIALEGALKIKEISYRHAEGYAAGELKHGPIALIDTDICAIVLCPSDELARKTLSNLQEIKSRKGWIVGIGDRKYDEFRSQCDEYLSMPTAPFGIAPMLYVLPLQLAAYGLARQLGCDIDKPRNLAKSVTVE